MVGKVARKIALVSLLSAALGSQPLLAADATATGIVAGLGLTAASGKSTVAGGGAIEASLLTSDALLKAGLGIRQLVKSRVHGGTVIILAHADTLDLSLARWLPQRIPQIQEQVERMIAKPASCGPSIILPPKPKGPTGRDRQAFNTLLPSFAPTDITAAVTTDYNIAGITLSADDRMLVNAIEMSSNTDTSWHDIDKTPVAPKPVPSPEDDPQPHFTVLGESVDVNPKDPANDTIRRLVDLQNWANHYRPCTSAEFKAAVSVADAFVSSVTSADKGVPPILTAVELAPLVADDAHTHVLRIAIEAIGGTSVSRSNIWYALGFPGAVSITSGLLVSFRLFDPETGADEMVGEMRCALAPTNLRKVGTMMITDKSQLQHPEDVKPPAISCGYRLS